MSLDSKHPTGPLSQLFGKQLEVVRDPSKFKVLLCGGRAGKTSTCIYDYAHGMQTEAGSANCYIGQTRTSAKNIFWEPFRVANRKHGWGFDLNESELKARHPNGSWLLCAGSDTRRELEKVRGIPWRRVRIDECGSHRPLYLQYLVEEVLEARLMDKSGDLWLLGTPTKQAYGYFYDASNGRLPGWSLHHWTARDNPHIDFNTFVFHPETGLLARRGWTVDHPIFRREYLAEWVVESTLLVYRFLRERNVVRELPKLQNRRDRWRRVLGLDFGVMDATAAVLLVYPELYGREVYVEKVWQQTGLAPSDAADTIMRDFVTPFRPDLIVGDVGGIGKAFQREWNKRYPGVEMKAAEKKDKRTAIEITSDALYVASIDDRRGLFSLDCNEELHREWATLLWDEKREDIAEGQDDNLANAAQYGYRECPAYSNALQPVPVDPRPRHLQEDDEDYVPPPRHYQEVSDL